MSNTAPMARALVVIGATPAAQSTRPETVSRRRATFLEARPRRTWHAALYTESASWSAMGRVIQQPACAPVPLPRVPRGARWMAIDVRVPEAHERAPTDPRPRARGRDLYSRRPVRDG